MKKAILLLLGIFFIGYLLFNQTIAARSSDLTNKPAATPTPSTHAQDRSENPAPHKVSQAPPQPLTRKDEQVVVNKGAGNEIKTNGSSANLASQLGNQGEPENDSKKGTPDKTQNTNRRDEHAKDDSQSLSLFGLIIYGVVGLVLLSGIGVGIYFLWKNREQEKARLQGSFNSLKAKDKELGTKLDGFQKIVTDLSQQVAQQKSEILKLKQGVANQPAAASSFSTPVFDVPREQPRFPVAVDDYLVRIGPNRRSVKYDYKERLLIPDPTEEGNLLIVQDEGSLYVVPSFTTFSTKSDYTTYLEPYYGCAKPMAGTIWIRQPAAVMKSGNGWKLASAGDLEVR